MINVFLVDDHPIMIEGYKALLKGTEINVVGFALSGIDFIKTIKDNNYDVLVLDISMPGFNGVDVLKHIQANNYHIKTLVVSSYCDINIIDNCINYGAKGYILKEETADSIIEGIKEIYKGGKFFSESVRDFILDSELYKDDKKSLFDIFSPKEGEVLMYLERGFDPDEITDRMHISNSSFRTHLSNIRSKLNLKNNWKLSVFINKHRSKIFIEN